MKVASRLFNQVNDWIPQICKIFSTSDFLPDLYVENTLHPFLITLSPSYCLEAFPSFQSELCLAVIRRNSYSSLKTLTAFKELVENNVSRVWMTENSCRFALDFNEEKFDEYVIYKYRNDSSRYKDNKELKKLKIKLKNIIEENYETFKKEISTGRTDESGALPVIHLGENSR